MNLAAGLAFLVATLIGGLAYQYSDARSNAVIYFHDGHVEQVEVTDHGTDFCPASCKVAHRHQVHDIRWDCSNANRCTHYTVFHVIQYGEESRIAALKRELRSVEPPAAGTIAVLATQDVITP